MDEPKELRDVPALLLHERRVRIEVPREQLRAVEELEEQSRRRELRGASGVVREVGAEDLRRRDG